MEKSLELLTRVYILGIIVSCSISLKFTLFLFLKSYLFNPPGLCVQISVAWKHKESWFKAFGKLCKEVIIPLGSFVRWLNLIPLHERSVGRPCMPLTQCLSALPGSEYRKNNPYHTQIHNYCEEYFFLKFLIRPLQVNLPYQPRICLISMRLNDFPKDY